MASQKEAAAHLDLSVQALQDLIKRKVLPKAERGQIDLDLYRIAYLRHLRSIAAGHKADPTDEGPSIVDERARLAKAQAERAEMENELRRGELVEIEKVDTAVMATLHRVRTRYLTIPSKLAPVVASNVEPAECEQLIRQAVVEVLRELSETNVAKLAEPNGKMVDDTKPAA